MVKNVKKPIYRISFVCQDNVFEIYAKHVGESDMFGFVEVEEFVFGETTQLLVDPSEERIKNEFDQVKRTYIPMHSILRIDEVEKEGVSKVFKSKGSNVTTLNSTLVNQGKRGD